jgi:hypothetical protein
MGNGQNTTGAVQATRIYVRLPAICMYNGNAGAKRVVLRFHRGIKGFPAELYCAFLEG